MMVAVEEVLAQAPMCDCMVTSEAWAMASVAAPPTWHEPRWQILAQAPQC